MEVRLTPIQTLAFSLAKEFANQKIEQPDKNLSNDEVSRDMSSLEIKLPRKAGSTLICHLLSNEFDCLTVLPHQHAADLFEIDHRVPQLTSGDLLTQIRLNKFDQLVRLSQRWKDEYRNQFDGILERIRNHRRRGKNFDANTLKELVELWADDSDAEIGRRPNKLIENRLLSLSPPGSMQRLRPESSSSTRPTGWWQASHPTPPGSAWSSSPATTRTSDD